MSTKGCQRPDDDGRRGSGRRVALGGCSESVGVGGADGVTVTVAEGERFDSRATVAEALRYVMAWHTLLDWSPPSLVPRREYVAGLKWKHLAD